VHVSVSPSYAVLGLRVTLVMDGAVLLMVTLELASESVSVPSLAVAVHTTASPRSKYVPLRVLPVVPVELPATVHA
jgi:hypothetical protein